MGIVNATDDSFSGDGLGGDASAAVRHAERLIAEGADILDIGAESTRPGAAPVSPQQEMDRVLPLVERLHDSGRPLSIDTMKPEVMKAALSAGADMINDVMALRAPGALETVAASRAAVCLMHMQGEPRTMQNDPHYNDVVAEVERFLSQRVEAAQAAGIARTRIVLDPGFGFGKSLAHNLSLLRRLDELKIQGLPLLVGMSRKSMLGQITGRPPEARLHGGIAAAMQALRRGAAIVRVHDVAPIRDAIAVWNAVEESNS